MSADCLYFRPNIQVEPLFDSWYAWSYLIPPATAARNLTERHLKIMDSYLRAPHAHAQAVRDPRMRGGPFIDYDGKRVAEIETLRNRTKVERANLIELSTAISSLDAMLRTNAKGFSLQPLYGQVPPILRGYVELVYDLNNNPSFRIIESLLYRSKYYDRSAQSLRLSLINADDRPFVLSTPRLESEGSINVPVPFDNEVVDRLFRLKTEPQPWEEICEMLKVGEHQVNLLRSMFTKEPPRAYQAYMGPGARWRYFGHACILVEARGRQYTV